MPWPAGPTAAVAPPRHTKPILLIAAVVGLVVALVGTVAFISLRPGASQVDPAIMAVLQANLDATNNEDIAAYMACLDPSSPAYATTQTQMTAAFAAYKLHVEMNEESVVDVTATVAHVHVVLTTKKISGPAFTDNRVTAVMELHKVNGAWKIYGQTIQKVESL